MPRAGNGTLAAIILKCRACRASCQELLAQLDTSADTRAAVAPTLRCVAFLTMIADTLEARAEISADLIGVGIEMARDLADDAVGCAETCRIAADALSEWLDGGFEHS